MADVRLTSQQQAVVEDRGGTLLVSAAAGSGKTKVLVDRVLRRIVNEGKNINEFLIITFTNAAAAELRSKISQAITKELSNQPSNRHLSRQLSLLHLAQISTVHAFCGALLRQYGYLLEIPSDNRMLDDGERKELLSQQLEQVLEDAYTREDPDFLALTDTLGAGRTDARLEDYILSVYEKVLSQPDPQAWLRQQTLVIPADTDLSDTVWGNILIEYARQQLRGLVERYTWAISSMQGDEKLEKSYLPAYEAQRHSLQQMLAATDGPWDFLAACFSMEYPSVRVTGYPDKAHLQEIQAVKSDGKKLLEELQRIFSRPSEALISEHNQMAPALGALLELVRELDRRFSAEKRRKNLLDFSDQEHLAIRLLTQGEMGRQVALEVAQGFTEIMVDEYQDSNRVQEVIFRAISGAKDENRFLVGDVKQSIYGFRNAEPQLFLDKYNAFVPAEQAAAGEPRKLVLSRNFRSRPEILEAVNHTFSTVMSQQVGDIVYGADERLYPGLEEYPPEETPCVELHVLELPRTSSGETVKNQLEAQWVTQRIVELLDSGASVRDGTGLRPMEPSDIALLFRTREPIALFSRTLREAGIPVASDAAENLFDTPEVKVLVNLLRVLNNPHQDIPLLAVLCSPLFLFSNQQLAEIRAGSSQKRFYDAMRGCPQSWCVQTLETLERLRRQAATISGDRLVWSLLYDTGLLAAYSAMEQGDARRENLLAVYEFARSCGEGSFLYLYQLLRLLERAKENKTLTAQRQSQGVILTTMHKSKGLEYPVVFLPCLAKRFNTDELSEPILFDGDLGLAAQVTDLERRIRYPGVAFEAMKLKLRQEMRSEELRVLYVAMTRAKDRLILSYADRYLDSTLTRLRAGAGQPAALWCTAKASQMGDWVLLSALNRMESGALFERCGRPDCTLTVSNYSWLVRCETAESIHSVSWTQPGAAAQRIQTIVPSPEELLQRIRWQDPHAAAAITPSKVTATQLKGRDKDEEAADGTQVQVRLPQLRRPEFVLEKQGLSPTERGTAVHLFLQYASYASCTTQEDVASEKLRLEDDLFMTEEQLSAVDPVVITRLFQSTLGQRLLHAPKLIREFKFSLLDRAEDYFPDVDGEQLLLQGVIDAAWMEEDGLCVLDFKTDRVTQETIDERTEYYRGQLESYQKALERIFQKPVKEMYLYYLAVGKEVRL